MSFDDFCKCTADEIEEIFKSWKETREEDVRGEWERMRLHAVMVMQPHCKKKLNPSSILPLPWEKKKVSSRNNNQIMSKELQKKRFEELAKRRMK